MKKIIASIVCIATVGLALLTSPPAMAGVQNLIQFGSTNAVPANTTNYFGGTVIAGNQFAKDIFVTWGFTLSGSSSSTNYLQIDTSTYSGTNSIYVNGFWTTNSYVTNLIANGTNPVVLNFNIPANVNGGGAPLYRFSMVTSNGSSLYMSNIVLAVDVKNGI